MTEKTVEPQRNGAAETNGAPPGDRFVTRHQPAAGHEVAGVTGQARRPGNEPDGSWNGSFAGVRACPVRRGYAAPAGFIARRGPRIDS